MAQTVKWRLARRVCAGVVGASIAAVAVPVAAQACSLPLRIGQPVTPLESASIVQSGDPVPVRVRFGDGGTFTPVQVSVARLKSSTLPLPGAGLTPDLGTVVETISLTYDPATESWGADANGNGWAQTPGEYIWQASATQTIPASPPPVPPAGATTCDGPFTIVHDGQWLHRLTVLGDSAVKATAAKARDGRAKVNGRIAKAFPGKVKLTVACPGRRARTTWVTSRNGRWQRTVAAKRGCTVKAAVAARSGWAASEASARVT